MKYLTLTILLISSCSTHKKYSQSETISVDTALNLARTGYVRSCIQAHKEHEPSRSWRRQCLKEANLYLSELFEFVEK